MSLTALETQKHIDYVQKLGKNHDLAFYLTSHLRLNAVYWGFTAVSIMGQPTALERDDMIDFVMSCWDDKQGGFGTFPGHDAHVLSTLSAIQILVMQNAADKLDKERVTKYILSLQTSEGSFMGDRWGEIDTRFGLCATMALSLLGSLSELDLERTVGYIRRCRNFDGGFGGCEGGESHAAQVYVCLGTLVILDRLDEVDQPTLAWWLAERQLPNGGLNGRPEKLEDVCYSFWVLSSLAILRKLHWIDADALTKFILSAQDPDAGGIADRPGDMADVFHTLFGVAGLSLLGYPSLVDIDPVYCMPAATIEKLGLRKDWRALPRRTPAA
ncbi:Rab geranylgeranyl transferase type II beta subunit, putative [Rhizoctonia solani AG-3 Rhs1AP]|uniref:Geranylgeranyl transferase type-2 subunit beta n=1 Tax=Rhizoctonia solani AG-3 Rhs1AP TaxID=1086054 RepID=X8JKY2_9AGAM|nr:Rab geranylgeranyl transferase type II beta subunit, putative [Rhizoctonia solani AG-3 Rhs1AP]